MDGPGPTYVGLVIGDSSIFSLSVERSTNILYVNIIDPLCRKSFPNKIYSLGKFDDFIIKLQKRLLGVLKEF